MRVQKLICVLITLMYSYTAFEIKSHDISRIQEKFVTVCCHQREHFDTSLIKCIKNSEGERHGKVITLHGNLSHSDKSSTEVTTTTTDGTTIKEQSQISIVDPITKSTVETYTTFYFKPGTVNFIRGLHNFFAVGPKTCRRNNVEHSYETALR